MAEYFALPWGVECCQTEKSLDYAFSYIVVQRQRLDDHPIRMVSLS